MEDGEKRPETGNTSWAELSEMKADFGEAKKEKMIAEIDAGVDSWEKGQFGYDPEKGNPDPEYQAELRDRATKAAELLPEWQRDDFIKYIQSRNGYTFGSVYDEEDIVAVANGINRVKGGESLEDYRKYEYGRLPEGYSDVEDADLYAQNIHEAVVGFFGPAEQALNRRNRLLDAVEDLQRLENSVSEAHGDWRLPDAVAVAREQMGEALHKELVMATAVAAVLFVPEEQRQGLKEYAAENADTSEFEDIATGIFRYGHGDYLADIQADLFPVDADESIEAGRKRNAKNREAYNKMVGFLGQEQERMPEEAEKAEEGSAETPEWIKRFLRGE